MKLAGRGRSYGVGLAVGVSLGTGTVGVAVVPGDRFADPRRVALTLYNLGFKLGTDRLPEKNVRQYVSNRMDDLGVGAELERFPYGRTKFVTLPPSRGGKNPS